MEMVLSTGKGGAGWRQLNEQAVPVDGKEHTLRWQLPCSGSAVQGYRWARLIMNSPGDKVSVSSVRITNADLDLWKPDPLAGPEIDPENGYTWSFGSNSVLLSGGNTEGNFQSKIIPLSAIIDSESTPGKTWSVKRLYLQTTSAAQTCIIRSIHFQ